MTDQADAPELEAVNAIFKALKPLPDNVKDRVLDAVRVLLGKPASSRPSSETNDLPPPIQGEAATQSSAPTTVSDIRSLKEQKSPTTATQMTAMVAYYLSEVAPAPERKQNIDQDDLKKYFKQANYPLPASEPSTLVNTKNAGYIDAVGEGQYKLNPVGHNLVVHALPKDGTMAATPARRKRKNATRKNANRAKSKRSSTKGTKKRTGKSKA